MMWKCETLFCLPSIRGRLSRSFFWLDKSSVAGRSDPLGRPLRAQGPGRAIRLSAQPDLYCSGTRVIFAGARNAAWRLQLMWQAVLVGITSSTGHCLQVKALCGEAQHGQREESYLLASEERLQKQYVLQTYPARSPLFAAHSSLPCVIRPHQAAS